MRVAFWVLGRVPSNNRVTRNVNGVSLKSREAREYQARVKSIALSSVPRDWDPSQPVRVTIEHFNGRIDLDNCAKVILDGMKGVFFVDDRRKYVCELNLVAATNESKAESVAVTVATLEEVGAPRKREPTLLAGDGPPCHPGSMLTIHGSVRSPDKAFLNGVEISREDALRLVRGS